MPFFQNLSVQRKLTMVIFCTSLLGLSITGMAFEVYERASFRHALVSELEAHAGTLGLNTAASLAFNDRKSAQDLLASLRVEKPVFQACLYDLQGTIFAEYRRELAISACPRTAPPTEGAKFDKEAVVYTKSLTLSAENIGTLAIFSDYSVLHARMMRFRLVSGIVLIFSILATALVANRLVGLITEPILQLAALAQQVSSKEDYTLRAFGASEDEVGRLVRSFNQMLERIQERDVALHTAKEDLEIRVQERTEELLKQMLERSRAEEALSEERSRLRALIDNIPDFMYVKDVDSRFLVANLCLARQMGAQSAEEVIGKTDLDFFPRELATTYLETEQRVIRTGEPEVNRTEQCE
jgi:PAS domain-containing protein